MEKTLTVKQIEELAFQYQVDPIFLRAVIKTESSGTGFDKVTGKLLIQFEPHIFHRELIARGIQHTFTPNYKLSTDVAGKCVSQLVDYTIEFQGKSFTNGVELQSKEWPTFEAAKKIDVDSALLATSYGMSQVMGFNYKTVGFCTVQDMYDSFNESEYNQVKGMLNFIKGNRPLYQAIQKQDVFNTSLFYNGKNHVANGYPKKLQSNLDKLKSAKK